MKKQSLFNIIIDNFKYLNLAWNCGFPKPDFDIHCGDLKFEDQYYLIPFIPPGYG